MQSVRIRPNELKLLVTRKMINAGLCEEHASILADVLVHADLRGVSSHGVLRVQHYIRRIKKGGLNTGPKITIRDTGPSSAILDGDNGLGHVIANKAMDYAIQLAKKTGIGFVGIKNSSHCGALSYYVEQAVKSNMIGVAMSHTDSIVLPFGGTKPFFGTNPMAFGFPVKKHKPIIFDMATSKAALGKIIKAKEKGEKIPSDWGTNEKGEPVTDPEKVEYLLPLGGPKGYGLALSVDVLSGILTGSNFGPRIVTMYGEYHKYRKLGHLVLAIDPGIFISTDVYMNQVDSMIDEIHNVPSADGFDSVMVPGEPEQILEEKNIKYGVPIMKTVYEYLLSKE